MVRLLRVISLCRSYYDDDTFDHCLRVARYVIDNPCVTGGYDRDICCMLAMCHDLLEDTSCTVEEISIASGISEREVTDVMDLVSRKEDETYQEYIRRLKCGNNKYAYLIKIADMKDHLSQKDTLTDKLRDKYLESLPELL